MQSKVDKGTSTTEDWLASSCVSFFAPRPSKHNYKYQNARLTLMQIAEHFVALQKLLPEDMALSETINDEVTRIEVDKCLTASTRLQEEFKEAVKQGLVSQNDGYLIFTIQLVNIFLLELKSFRHDYLAEESFTARNYSPS